MGPIDFILLTAMDLYTDVPKYRWRISKNTLINNSIIPIYLWQYGGYRGLNVTDFQISTGVTFTGNLQDVYPNMGNIGRQHGKGAVCMVVRVYNQGR